MSTNAHITAWKYKIVEVGNGPITISTVGVIVHGAYINVALTTASITLHNGEDHVITVPKQIAAGSDISVAGDQGVLFDTNLVAISDGAGAGNITVFYRDLK